MSEALGGWDEPPQPLNALPGAPAWRAGCICAQEAHHQDPHEQSDQKRACADTDLQGAASTAAGSSAWQTWGGIGAPCAIGRMPTARDSHGAGCRSILASYSQLVVSGTCCVRCRILAAHTPQIVARVASSARLGCLQVGVRSVHVGFIGHVAMGEPESRVSW